MPTRDFICTFWFDDDGNLVQHRIDELGVREGYDRSAAENIWNAHLSDVGELDPAPFWVRPFSVEFAGFSFGLIPREMDEEEWQVTFEPGNTMAFYEPWDSGEYDT